MKALDEPSRSDPRLQAAKAADFRRFGFVERLAG
ncbi:MAG: hypothetical protein HW398_395 [Acidobacteria bacterium]|nr:hypothetical protein [Acidobacteriota bacterium]